MPSDPESHKSPGIQSRTDLILSRLVALNAERAAEEANGTVRWLRPEYQSPAASTTAASGKSAGRQEKLDMGAADASAASTVSTRAWPTDLPAQAAALSHTLEELQALCTLQELAAQFEGKPTKKRLDEMERLLHTLAAVGRARHWKGKWAGA